MSLTQIGIKHNSDKAYLHKFTDHYEPTLGPVKHTIHNMLEIGIETGASLNMWKEWLPHAHVYAIDTVDCTHMSDDRCTIWKMSQTDVTGITEALQGIALDLIVDDGSHFCNHQQITLQGLWPLLKSGGWYIIEDIHTSTWPDFHDAAYCTTQQWANDVIKRTAANSLPTHACLKHIEQQLENLHVYTGPNGSTHSQVALLKKK